MCQSVPAGYGAPTLPPHQYPLGIKVFAGVVAVVALYGLFSTPHALMSLHQLRAADALYNGGNFPGAAQAYEGVLKEAPRSGTAKLGAAKAYFHLHDESADKKALTLLVGMELDKYDAEDLAKVMPEKYWDLFTAGSRKGSVLLETVNGSTIDRPQHAEGGR